ncbi:MAG: cytochrome C biogenesis protein [Sphingomonadaceae bacterium]|nr:cytochrome C biogenesis protein [Sphingomonadaceae bacterium]
MIGWIAALALVALVLFWLWRLAEFRGSRLEWLGAALLIGLAGYAWQGSPAMEGSPTEPAGRATPASATDLDTQLIDRQQNVAGHWLNMTEALNRVGNHQGAAQAAQNGIESDPDNPDLWVGLANALILHGGGQMNAAAELALNRAAEIDPEHPGPAFFFGLAAAQAGQYDEAERLWSAMLARSPEDAPYRADLEQRLAEIASMRAAGEQPLLPVEPNPSRSP